MVKYFIFRGLNGFQAIYKCVFDHFERKYKFVNKKIQIIIAWQLF